MRLTLPQIRLRDLFIYFAGHRPFITMMSCYDTVVFLLHEAIKTLYNMLFQAPGTDTDSVKL